MESYRISESSAPGTVFSKLIPACAHMREPIKEEITLDTPIGGLLLIQVVLIAINAFFAAAEIAVVSLSETMLRHQAEKSGLSEHLSLTHRSLKQIIIQ